jgi:hypothetical protein
MNPSPELPQKKVNTMLKTILAFLSFIVILSLAGVGLAGAADSAAPGDALYELDLQMETLQSQLIEPGQQARLQEQFAQERLDELESLAADSGSQDLDQALGATAQDLDEKGKNPKESPHCNNTAAALHPTGVKLAEEYDVAYDEIMGWYCLGFGFGEVKLAYSLGAEYGTPAADLFALRISGKSWGEIKQELKDR